jgi:NTP pyrophosphatase (non-canonical NTP hydrolase)
MTFEKYQKLAKKTAVYPKISKGFIYPLLGLAGETGEVFEKIKKVFRDKKGKIDKDYLQMIELEIGDILWYVANLCSELGLSLDEVAQKNIKKVFDRKKRNKIKGFGDTR